MVTDSKVLMKTRIPPINLFALRKSTIHKIFTLFEDKDLLSLREICHTAKEMIDDSILSVRKLTADFELTYLEEPASSLFNITINSFQNDEHNVEISLATYFDDLRSRRNNGLLRIALAHIRSKFPLFRIKPHEHVGHATFTIKLEDFNTFLDQLAPRIAGIQWRWIQIYDAPPDIIRSFSDFFNEKHVELIHTCKMLVENSDYSPWLTLIKNATAEGFSFALSVLTKDEVNFLIEVSESVDSASISFVNDFQSNISLVSLAMVMLNRKCFRLDFSLYTSIFTHSDLRTLLAFFHQIGKKVSFRANTHGPIQFLQVGLYFVNVYEFTTHPPDGRRTIIAPIDV